MTVAVVVARADDARPRWRRRHRGGVGARGGGQFGVAGRGGAAGPATGGRGYGDGRGFQGHEPRGDRRGGGGARGAGGGDGRGRGADDEPPAAEAIGGGGAARQADEARGAARGGADGAPPRLPLEAGRDAGHRTGAPIVRLREDTIEWMKGNTNTAGESSGDIGQKSSEKLPQPVARRATHFLPFNEPEVFQNNLEPQNPEVDELNDELVLLFESISVLRKNTYEMMCTLPEANDQTSCGKQIGEETKKADGLIKLVEEKASRIKALGGEALPIPDQFYLDVKPL